jgi:hypothetical protein
MLLLWWKELVLRARLAQALHQLACALAVGLVSLAVHRQCTVTTGWQSEYGMAGNGLASMLGLTEALLKHHRSANTTSQ